MDVCMLALFLACFGSVVLLLLWCGRAALRKER